VTPMHGDPARSSYPASQVPQLAPDFFASNRSEAGTL
jgi:hypothetical protein